MKEAGRSIRLSVTQGVKGLDQPFLALNMGAGHQPRNAGGLQKLKKAREWILP